jgi:hypothetical protein
LFIDDLEANTRAAASVGLHTETFTPERDLRRRCVGFSGDVALRVLSGAVSESQLAEQGSGVNAAPSGSFLKCVLRTKGYWRLSGSVTSLTMVSQDSPFGVVIRW